MKDIGISITLFSSMLSALRNLGPNTFMETPRQGYTGFGKIEWPNFTCLDNI